MGTWGTGLYANDTAADLRHDFRQVVRAPWDGERLSRWALSAYPGAADRTDADYTDLRLALADLFWTYGIDHRPTIDVARKVIREGIDLAAKRTLGMSEPDLRRRASVLAGLGERLRWANPAPRPRRILDQPEPFLLEAGDCLSYPLTNGKLRNPYVKPRDAAAYDDRYPWEPNGWGAALVMGRFRKLEVLARYVVAILATDPAAKVSLVDVPRLSIVHQQVHGGGQRRLVHGVAVSRLHLRRMQVEVIGRLTVDADGVARELGPDNPDIARYGMDHSLAEIGDIGGVRRRLMVSADDPVGRLLVP